MYQYENHKKEPFLFRCDVRHHVLSVAGGENESQIFHALNKRKGEKTDYNEMEHSTTPVIRTPFRFISQIVTCGSYFFPYFHFITTWAEFREWRF